MTVQFNYNIARLLEYCNKLDTLFKQSHGKKLDDLENTIKYLKGLLKVYNNIGLTYVPWDKTYELAMIGINFGSTQPSQGTQEWLNQRLNRISASDIASALGENEYKSPDIVIIDKCGYPKHWWWDESSSQFTHHGHKFEFIASQIHEANNDVKCYEASFIPHPTIDFIGASPDKFVLCQKNKRGYLIEIKCPYRRYPKLNVVPRQYWIQMQIQLEVTNLEECYFEDCRIIELKFDELDLLTDPCEYCGVIGEIQDLVGETTIFVYPKLHKSGVEDRKKLFENMKEEIMVIVKDYQNKSERYHFSKFTWWKLGMHQSILVLRDREWFAEILPKLETFWKKVLWHRENGYDDLVRKYNQPIVADLK